MKNNKNSLSIRAKNIAKEKNISVNIVYSRYFFDCFLKRLSVSPYAKKFVLKGDEKAMNTLKSVKSNMIQRKRWETYTKKMSYAKEVSFDDIISSINHLLEILI